MAGYWSADTAAAAVVMLTDRAIDDWPARYQSECLAADEQALEAHEDPGSPVRARITVRSRAGGGMTVTADHFLLHIPAER